MQPNRPQLKALLDSGVAHHQAGRLEVAIDCYRRILAVDARNVDAMHFLGLLRHQQGASEEAVRLISSALEINKNMPGALANLGVALLVLKRRPEAIDAFRRALKISPKMIHALINLGCALEEDKQPEKAIPILERALAIDPNSVTVLYNLGNAKGALGNLVEAEACYRRVLNIDPGHVKSLNNLGNVLLKLNRPAEALDFLKRAVSAVPGSWSMLNNCGRGMMSNNRYVEAEKVFREVLWGIENQASDGSSINQALDQKRELAYAWNNLGNLLTFQCRLDEAEIGFRSAFALNAELQEVWSNLLFCRNYHPRYSMEEIFAEYRRWNDQVVASFVPQLPPRIDWDGKRRLRVGYVSPDLCNHPVRYFINPLFENFDKSRFELFGYAEVAMPDNHTARFQACCDHWLFTLGLSDDSLAQKIRDDRIDILVDLAGHTDGNRLLVFARKPAPIQISYLGFGCSTGLAVMDYFLADKQFVPEGHDAVFSETVWRLPRSMYCYDPPEGMPEVAPLPALRNGFVTFGCFSRSIRYNDLVIALWSRLLAAIPTARLVLNTRTFADPGMQDLFAERFAQHGIQRERLDLVFTSPQEVTWAKYNDIDICLDPFPHNSGTTLFEALWMGVPTISLSARPPLGRFGATILHSLQLEDWLASSEDEYISIAIEKCQSIELLARLRCELRQNMADSPLCDKVSFAHCIEEAYVAMVASSCRASRNQSGD